ncbi:alpha/beta fold hydrolase [Streptomyces galilaeus]|uniref:alpha/beta fold hydrolase n=1 Tax=Streptomyces galilaeus TaxID=33899 RepID=UPI0038F67A25
MSHILSMELPASAVRSYVTTSRGQFAALCVQPRKRTGQGVALLVPGFNGSKEDFLPLLDPLADAGYKVIAMDLRGQYETGPASADAQYHAEGLASDLTMLAHSVGEGDPVHLVGHSYGGLLARLAVLRNPAPESVWASLTLVNFGPAAVSPWQQERASLLLSVLESSSLADIWPFLKPEDPSIPATALSFLQERWERNEVEALRAAVRQMLSERDRTADLQAAGVPTSVICGAPDQTWPEAGVAEMARRLRAPYTELTGGGHSPNVHTPLLMADALLSFWSSTDRAAARCTGAGA